MTGVNTASHAGPDRVLRFADSLEASSATAVAPEPTQWETWVTFAVGAERFGFRVDRVREIIRVETVTRVPHAPFPVRGIVNLRGRVVPVLDLRVRLGLPAAPLGRENRILVCEAHGRALGLLVDAAHQVARVDRLKVTPPPADVLTSRSGFVTGVYDMGASFLILLDADQVLLVPNGTEEAPASPFDATTPAGAGDRVGAAPAPRQDS
jgi:purine-binding chemotaxis protein CheW